MTCTFCGNEHKDDDNFCPRCGQGAVKKYPYSEFELGRIAALETIVKDFRQRYILITAVIGVLALLGVNELAKNSVRDAVNDHIKAIQGKIDNATLELAQSSAKADIEVKRVDTTLTDLNTKKSELEKSIEGVNLKEAELEQSITGLKENKRRMLAATTDLQEKETALKQIIDRENLATTFAELRNDHYRVRTLKARAVLEFSELPPGTVVSYVLNTISLSRGLPKMTVQGDQYVVQFFQTAILGLNNQLRSPSAVVATYEMYVPYERRIGNHSMRNLNGIDTISLQFGPVVPTPPDTPDSVLNNLDKLFSLTKNLTIEIELNGTLIAQHQFSKEELKLPNDRSALISSGTVKLDISKDVTSSYKDVKALYDERAAVLVD